MVAGAAAATPDVAIRVAQRIAAIGDAVEKTVAAWTKHSRASPTAGITPLSDSSHPQSSPTVSSGCIRLLFAAWRLGYQYSATTVVAIHSCLLKRISTSKAVLRSAVFRLAIRLWRTVSSNWMVAYDGTTLLDLMRCIYRIYGYTMVIWYYNERNL